MDDRCLLFLSDLSIFPFPQTIPEIDMVEGMLISLNNKLHSAEVHIANQEASLAAAAQDRTSLATRILTLEGGYAVLSGIVTAMRPNHFGVWQIF